MKGLTLQSALPALGLIAMIGLLGVAGYALYGATTARCGPLTEAGAGVLGPQSAFAKTCADEAAAADRAPQEGDGGGEGGGVEDGSATVEAPPPPPIDSVEAYANLDDVGAPPVLRPRRFRDAIDRALDRYAALTAAGALPVLRPRPFKASLDPAAPGDAGDEDAADDAQDVVIDAPDADAGDDEAPGGDPAADDAAGDDPATDGDAAGGDPGDGDAADGGAAPGGEDGAADAGPEPGAGDGPPAGDDDAAEAPDAPDPADPDADAPTDPLAGLFAPPGALTPDSGRGATDATVYAPNIVFPLDDEAYANSQVWGVGGYRGPGGRGQCDPRNYSYPWRDNFCETRSRANERCPAGKGHHGQDIRPATCKKDTHWAVAVEPGVITSIGSYTVTLLGNSGREYRYMHLNMRRLAIKRGDQVTAGQRIGLVSNFFGGTPTTIHLHFEIRLVTRENGRLRKVFVPPYTSLVAAYRRLLAAREGG